MRRAAYAGQDYWAGPAPNLYCPDPASAKILLVGLAPGAHGANRTGRLFTGDRSGDFLFAALHRAGLCSSPRSVSRDDGLQLIDLAITAVCHCAPPDNKPAPGEIRRCRPFLISTLESLPSLRAIVALGGLAFAQMLTAMEEMNWAIGRPRPRFSHGAVASPPSGPVLIASYHPSQQNTFTGRLTPGMLDEALRTACKAAGRR